MDKPIKSDKPSILGFLRYLFIENGFVLAAAVYFGFWQKSMMAGWAMWFCFQALNQVLRSAFSHGVAELANVAMLLANRVGQ